MGGPKAPLSPQESVIAMRRLIADFRPKSIGQVPQRSLEPRFDMSSALLILLNFSYSSHRSTSDFIMPSFAYGLAFNSADNSSKPRSTARS